MEHRVLALGTTLQLMAVLKHLVCPAIHAGVRSLARAFTFSNHTSFPQYLVIKFIIHNHGLFAIGVSPMFFKNILMHHRQPAQFSPDSHCMPRLALLTVVLTVGQVDKASPGDILDGFQK